MNTSNNLRLQQTPTHQAQQYSSLPLQISSTNFLENQQQNAIAECGTAQRLSDQVAAIQNQESSMISGCNYRNCSMSGSLNNHQKNSRRADVVFQTPQHNRIRRNHEKETERNMLLSHNHSSNAILPPPLFDESSTAMNVSTLPLTSDSIHQIKSRRHHRTIPRHFTVAASVEQQSMANHDQPAKHNSDDDLNRTSSYGEPSSSSSIAVAAVATATVVATANKKSVCQCPVQHVPMTYMASNHLNMSRPQPNDMLLSTLSRKSASQRANVAKSASFNSTPSPVSTVVPGVGTYHRNSASGLLSVNTSTSHTVALKPNSTPTPNSNGNLHRQKSSQKIPTISKQIGNHEFGCNRSPTTQSLNSKSILSTDNTRYAQSKNDLSDEIKPTQLLNNNEMYSSPFPIQLIESIGKNQSKNFLPSSPINPALPPKMCKIGNTNSPSGRIQTISKPIPNTLSYVQQSNDHVKRKEHRDRTKSPVREKSLPLSTAIDGRNLVQNQGKTNYPPTYLSMSSNHFTLPKSSSNSKNSLTEIVNKIPKTVSVNEESLARGKSETNKLLSHARKHEEKDGKLQSSNCIDYQALTSNSAHKSFTAKDDKQLPICTTYNNCSNPKEHFLPNDTSLDDDYLSECENCKSAHGSRYFLDEENEEQPQETMTLQRKMDEKEDEQTYYRTSSTLPTNTKQKTT